MWDGFYAESRPAEIDKEWLGHLVFESKAKPLMINPLQVYAMPEKYKELPVYIVSPGMGDIAWVYSKLSSLGKKFALAICDSLPTNENPRYSRSMPFARLLPNVVHSTIAFCEPHQAYVMTAMMKVSNGFFPTSGYLCANKWLETGNNLDDFLPSVATNRHFEMLKPEWAEREADAYIEPGEKAICFYTASRAYYGAYDQNLPIREWVNLIQAVSSANPGHKVVLVGSPWDMDLMRPIYEILKATHSKAVEIIFDRDIAVTLAVLRRSKFLVGCVSGLTIVSEYQKVPTVHLYPKHLVEQTGLMGTWESPVMVDAQRSLSIPIAAGMKTILKRVLSNRHFKGEASALSRV